MSHFLELRRRKRRVEVLARKVDRMWMNSCPKAPFLCYTTAQSVANMVN